MKTSLVSAVMGGLICLYCASVLAQTALWVSSEGAKLKSEDTAMSETLAIVPVGTEVNVLKTKDRWHLIAIPSGKEGWMYRGRLSDTPPETREADQGTDLFAGLTGSGIQADEASTARSIRGLSEETKTYADNQNTPVRYREALDQVLAMRITEKQLENFLKTGHIGEYAK